MFRTALAASLALLTCGATQTPSSNWQVVVLGIAQDAGIPHLSCQQTLCASIRAGQRRAEKVSSLGLIDRAAGRAYVFDATPDFNAQVHALTGGKPPEGVFLTHAHIGHYTGLMYLGRESIGARAVPVYGTDRMLEFLDTNGPWSQLIALGNIERRPLSTARAVTLPGGVQVTAFRVPHRDEFSDTSRLPDRRAAPQRVVYPRHRSMGEMGPQHPRGRRRRRLRVPRRDICVAGGSEPEYRRDSSPDDGADARDRSRRARETVVHSHQPHQRRDRRGGCSPKA